VAGVLADRRLALSDGVLKILRRRILDENNRLICDIKHHEIPIPKMARLPVFSDGDFRLCGLCSFVIARLAADDLRLE
jgi:hypothetical protein